jgi:hypothetical protein
MADTTRIRAALAELVVSLNMSETEATSLVNDVFEKLGWSGRVVVPKTSDIDFPVRQGDLRPDEAKADLARARLLAAYEVLTRDSDLSNPALAEDERLRRAENLLSTYRRLRRRDPDFHDSGDQLRAARRIQKAAYRQRHRPKPT